MSCPNTFIDDENVRAYRDTKIVMQGQFMLGEQEGRHDALLETARKMKADGMVLEMISKYTSLSPADIEAL